jgi:excisionase family DNA binding protein
MNDMGFPVARVLEGIEAAAVAGLRPVKVNMVVKRGVNERSILGMPATSGAPGTSCASSSTWTWARPTGGGSRIVRKSAKKLQVSKAALYDAITRGEIPSVKVGRRVLIPRARLMEWLGETS